MRKIVLFIVALVALQKTNAQILRKPSFSAGFQVVQPMKGFLRDENTPLGVGITASFPLFFLPIEFGLGYAWNSLGTREELLKSIKDANNVELNTETGLKVLSKLSRTSSFLRLRPLNGKLQPIIDGVCGVEVFKSDISLTDIPTEAELTAAATAEGVQTTATKISATAETIRSTKFYYGYALGLRYQIIPHILLEARVENLFGATAKDVFNAGVKLAQDGNIAVNKDPQALLEKKTDKFIVQFGIAIGL